MPFGQRHTPETKAKIGRNTVARLSGRKLSPEGGVTLGGRKFIVTCATLACAFVLALLGKLTADFATICAIVVGSFHAAHAVADYANRPK